MPHYGDIITMISILLSILQIFRYSSFHKKMQIGESGTPTPHGTAPALIKRANIIKKHFLDIFSETYFLYFQHTCMFNNYSMFCKIRGGVGENTPERFPCTTAIR